MLDQQSKSAIMLHHEFRQCLSVEVIKIGEGNKRQWVEKTVSGSMTTTTQVCYVTGRLRTRGSRAFDLFKSRKIYSN